MLKLLDLFSGIGGFSLGLERSGNFRTVGFCEIDKYCQKVLKKHWPDVPIHADIKTLKGDTFGEIDAICGGFPCQDISNAGKGAGLSGERSGLWFEFYRIVKEAKPKVVFIENVSALRSKGLDTILRQLSEIGYDAEWHCIPASAIGAPHQRDRLWILSYPHDQRWDSRGDYRVGGQVCADQEWNHPSSLQDGEQPKPDSGQVGEVLAHTNSFNVQGVFSSVSHSEEWKRPLQGSPRPLITSVRGQWLPEPSMGRVAHGVPHRVDRLKALGNAVVPQIPELLGKHYTIVI